ncbi:hypothetical protein EJ08DRAFT_7134 [Tothia fuscella]|uniref:Nuclear pore complex component n=1 Tax=Tothia fuscella TaxID=1048955 RepID=A0A9P4P3U0_9PEZI|nr:hypothetical protein EJ08DRAFT_7134 [Tothia fuscella]
MATAITTTSPSTPAAQTTIPPAAPTPPTGTWRHPRAAEIARRQQAATFNSQKLWHAIYNAIFLCTTFVVPGLIPKTLTPTLPALVAGYPTLAIRIYLLITIILSIAPLWKPKDDMSDIPLTPSQRKLLGLGPSSAPPTPGSAFITPPRYSRSTSRGSSGSRAANYGGSPLDRSTNGSPLGGSPLAGRGSGSPYGLSGLGTSPASGSPLVRKAVAGRRWSAGGSGLRESLRGSEVDFGESKTGSPGSSSPTAAGTGQRNASVALNSKWLYQRGKGSPGGRALYS